MKKSIPGFSKIEVCSVCESSQLDTIIDLPALPHIGIYLEFDADQNGYDPIDNGLSQCKQCGHIQMQKAVDPAFLYGNDFQHKTSESASAKQANNFLFGFISELIGSRAPKLVAEIGCNDTFFLGKFVEKYNSIVIGVDPILKGQEEKFLETINDGDRVNYKIAGDFIEGVNFIEQFGAPPDILVSNFVFEHLKTPLSVVKSMLGALSDQGICFIGVPTAEFMVFNARYDQLSHQHYQQFSVRSLHQLIENAGGSIIAHKINFTNWGQTIIAFGKKGLNPSQFQNFPLINAEIVNNSLNRFNEDLQNFRRKVEFLAGTKKIFLGFGAAQNFPIFHYFNKGQLPFNLIVDDHPLRQNKVFPFVQGIKTTKADNSYEGKIGVLTGPDYARVLFNRMGTLGFDHVVSPFTSY